MNRQLGAPLMLLVAVAWGLAARGATDGLGLTVTAVALATAAASAGVRSGDVRWGDRVTLALVALLAWLALAGTVHAGVSLASLRIPVLVLLAALTVRTVSSLERPQRELVLDGLVVLGIVHAAIAVTLAASDVAEGVTASRPLRVAGLVGHPNSLGVFLVATAALTARALERRPGVAASSALALQGAALLLTGSRLALAAALVLVAWAVRERSRGRLPVAFWAVVPWVFAALAVLAVRVATTTATRIDLWAAAVERFAQHPLVGAGPRRAVLEIGVPGARPTTHAHNELLQFAVDYGLVGVGLLTVTLGLALAGTAGLRSDDPWVVAAAVALVASGLTDVSLEMTPIAVSTAIVATIALRPEEVGATAMAVAGPRRRRRRVPSGLRVG